MIAWAGLLDYDSRNEEAREELHDLSKTTCTQRYLLPLLL